MKRFKDLTILFLMSFTLSLSTFAQKYTPANRLLLIGKPKETLKPYQRIDSAQSANMPAAVKKLARNSAGIAVLFETNSSQISVKWSLDKEAYFANMTPIAHSGLDLYCFTDGKWQYVSVGKPKKGASQDEIIISEMKPESRQFMLYLPLYNTLNDLQIGVDESANITSPKNPYIDLNKRIVVYGSSIVQGAAASRPGMTYPSIIQRKLNYDVINLGFSGNAKMEIELAKYLATVPADCYILDCIPNPTPAEIEERAYPFIKYLHEQKQTTPIILVETVIRENGYFNQKVGETVRRQNEEIKNAYDRLIKEGVKNVYYISADKLTGTDHEATIDGVHLTDAGFFRISDAILPVLKIALHLN